MCDKRKEINCNADTPIVLNRIFSIKRRGRLFKIRPRRPGVYSEPSVYLLNGFFSIESLFNQEPNFNKNVSKM